MGSSPGMFPHSPGSGATGPDLCSQSLNKFQQQLEQSKLLYKRQLAECRHQEHLVENLLKQRDSLQSQHEALLEQVCFSCHVPSTGLCLGEDSPSQGAQWKGWGDS